MSSDEGTFEVLTGDGVRWIIDSIHSGKAPAMARAQALLDAKQHDGVKVVTDTRRGNERVVFQQESTKQAPPPVTISPIQEAAMCMSASDLSGFEARKTVGRVLRKYLDDRKLTALELLHDHDLLREIQRTDQLYDLAIHRVASIQARELDVKPSDRNTVLYNFARELLDLARDAGATDSYVQLLDTSGLGAVLKSLTDWVNAATRQHFVATVLARYVGREKDWAQKLIGVFDLLEKENNEEARGLLDEVCAEILDGAAAVQDILGSQESLGDALRALAQLSSGRLDSEGNGLLLTRFNDVMRRFPMPATRQILQERVARAASSVQPLTRNNNAADKNFFFNLLKDVTWHGGLLGGPAMSEGMTQRARIVIPATSDDLTPAEAIQEILNRLPNNAVKIGYLMDLSRSEFGEKFKTDVLQALAKIVESVMTVAELLPPNSTREAIVNAVEDLRPRIGDEILGADIGRMINRRLDRLLLGDDKPEKTKTAKVDYDAAAKPPGQPQKPKKTTNMRVYAPGDVIFREGDPGDEAFMITAGAVKISLQSGDDEMELATLRRGQIFGEMALIDDQPRMATATAMEETAVSVVPQEAFKKRLAWLATEDRLIWHLFEIFVSRLRNVPAAED